MASMSSEGAHLGCPPLDSESSQKDRRIVSIAISYTLKKICSIASNTTGHAIYCTVLGLKAWQSVCLMHTSACYPFDFTLWLGYNGRQCSALMLLSGRYACGRDSEQYVD